MQTDKKLTLQQYIQCHNIKRQLRQRSKQKSRSKSRDRSASTSSIPANLLKGSFLYPNSTMYNNKVSSQQILNNTIYDQVDYRNSNLYNDMQKAINEIKLECRAIIKNDKEFSFFLKLMDDLLNKFRTAVMLIHRQNLLLFQISREVEKNYFSDRQNSVRTRMQNFQNILNEQQQLSKSQQESSLNFVQNKTIKEKMQQNKKGQQMVKAIFGGLIQGSNSDKKILKKYDTEPKDEKERQERKYQAVSFLGFIIQNIVSSKKIKSSQTTQPHPTLNPISSTHNLNPFLNLKSHQQDPKTYQKNLINTNGAQKLQENNGKETNFDTKNKKEDDRIVKNINYLNSRPKVDINTDEIDKTYNDQNVSFQALNPQIHLIERIKVYIPKSPQKNGQKQVDKVLNKNRQKVSDKIISGTNREKQGKRQGRITEENKHIQRKRLPSGQSETSPPSNLIAVTKMISSRSKGKVINKVSATKKAF